MNKTELLLTDAQKVDRGNRAAVLLGEDVYRLCMEDVYQCLHTALDNIPTDSAEQVMSIIRQLRVIKTINTKLEGWASEARRLHD